MEPYDYQTVVEVLEPLKRFQSFPAEHERNVLQSIIKEIFEEKKFFPAYSIDQLMKFAHMFGRIIKYGIVSFFLKNDKNLNEAYNFIFYAINKSPESIMFSFGIIALDQIKHILFKLREYCFQISTIPHLNNIPPELIKYVNAGKNQQKTKRFQEPIKTVPQELPKIQKLISDITLGITKPDTVTTAPFKLITYNASQSSEPLIANSAHANKTPTTVKKSQYNNEKSMLIPPEYVQAKITIIFNNLSHENVKNKSAEIKKNLNCIYLPWLSIILMQRICNEFRFHSLYLTYLEYFNSDPLNELIELETIRCIKILFMKNKSPQTRILPKSLGHWLGLITLAKDKPVPFDLKAMVIEAYSKGSNELEFTLLFVAKTLESCGKSKVYGPKTPWTMSILNCLAELHQTHGLKLIFQFEIEILFKMLKFNPRNCPDIN